MADRRGVCRLYASGSCRYGNRCKFMHERGGNATQALGENPGRFAQGAATPRPGPVRPAGGVPRQACNLFWTTGSCNRSFECTFQHLRDPNAAVGQGSATEKVPDETDEEMLPDFFATEALAMENNAARQPQYTLSPTEAHNNIKPFLRDNYHFESAAKVQGFVKILASINDVNKAWNSDKAQAFLESLVKGNGIVRIGDVLRFQPVDYHIGGGFGVLSFQKGYFPVLQYLASGLVLKSTLHKNINHLYTLMEGNYETIQDVIRKCIGGMIAEKSWMDPSLDGVVIFRTLSTVLLQYFNRFKDAIKNHPSIADLVMDISKWFETWATNVSCQPARFQDAITTSDSKARGLRINKLREEIGRLTSIVLRESEHTEKLRRIHVNVGITSAQRRQVQIMQFAQTYDPPGGLRQDGPRHDNDFSEISQIRIAPTNDELLSPLAPYLPVFLPDAPHHLTEHSMERHLDIQFRLLREELTCSIRASISAIYDDLGIIWNEVGGKKRQPTKLEEVVKKRGGPYKTSGFDSLFFYIYTNAQFSPVKAERRDLTVGLFLDTPAGTARSDDRKARYEYWEHGKRLQSGSLVALVLVTGRIMKVFLGVITSFGKDIAESSKVSADTVQIQISFFDPEVEFLALRSEKMTREASSYAFLVDNSVMYEASRPFLERLQSIEPTEIPFARYISRGGSVADVQVLPPRYATAPRFKFKLQCLAKDQRQLINDLDISQPNAVATARRQLLQSSILDPSQVEAVVNTFVREVSLIQGPPGTGKSFTAKEILRVLFASGIRPIVLIAYTNHALDHMLTGVLDANITQKLIRLGSRSSDERIAEYTLDKLEKVAAKTELDRSIGRQYAVMKRLEEQMTRVMESIQLPSLSWKDVEQFLGIHYPEHAEAFLAPPFWIAILAERLWADTDQNGEWTTVKQSKQKTMEEGIFSRTFYGMWREGEDLKFISPPVQSAQQKKGRRKKAAGPISPTPAPISSTTIDFFEQLGFPTLPPLPTTARATSNLLNIPTVWSMSLGERLRLSETWEQNIRTLAYENNLGDYTQLRASYKEACKDYNDIRDETRRRLLSRIDLIGCTTTGAAKLTNLLTSIAPKVLMVEEAGQVLEAHILTSIASVQHLICIGDPQQLRPTLATYGLSMDSERGSQLFKFDRSLMERLADGGMPMSQINVQRRMRPSISTFIRKILYPKLEDNDIVHQYPPVQGVRDDVYFVDHTNRENGTEDSVSKFNNYEVEMIRDLVLYFLRQGTYSGPGDIAVLCAYLGQLQKVRAALRDLKIAVALDERDEEQMVRQGLADDVTFEEVVVAKHIRLGTVDIFQGQEAKIVIVSLVRNTGTCETNSASIGFLKSSNRINVALSRAKHGLYIFGNASNLRKNSTWSTIIDEMEARDQIGPALPIVCPRHTEQAQMISKPGELDRFAPEGGCLIPCGTQLPCGHICPSVCHAVLDNHRSTRCHMPCSRTPCPRSHPCSRICGDDCGNCEFPIYAVTLPCGHTDTVPCHMMDKLDQVKCERRITKGLPRCEHTAIVPCHKDPASVECKSPCIGTMGCCSRTCKSTCSDCQKETVGSGVLQTKMKVPRTAHRSHKCERSLYCQHLCGKNCSQDHHCNPTCGGVCRQQCLHQKCKKPCSEPCAPCMEPCAWSCEHESCPVSCGSICTRLPCDEPCTNMLKCGHTCPSVCGELCAQQKCIECLPHESRQDIVDFIMQRRLEDVDLGSADTSERLITLTCGHVFTVETLDGHCGMQEYYEIDVMGKFVSTKAPPTEYQIPPCCPTCRGPISALRYGRVTKRASLDILEQNVASTMSRSLEALNPELERIVAAGDASQEAAKKIASDIEEAGEPAQSRESAAAGKVTEPLPHDQFTQGAMHSVHGFSHAESKAWYTVVKDVVNVYRKAHVVARTRGAHVKAYEGALTTLYRLELEAIANDPERATDTPEPLAMEAVNKKIGQPPHKADSRFQIEAYFRTLELRYTLAQIASSRITGLSVTATEEKGMKHRELWTSFVNFIYDSCRADAVKALAMAQKSSASRQAARCSIYVIRSSFEQYRFKAISARDKLRVSDPAFTQNRDTLAQNIQEMRREMQHSLRQGQELYVRSRQVKDMNGMRAERQWFQENCGRKVERFLEELDKLEEYVRAGGLYQPVSMQERKEIVKAFDFGYSGHFYNCPNGHPFVITECGGAMMTAKCPECDEPIGGGSHTLLASNTRNTEFEEILRQRGVGQGY